MAAHIGLVHCQRCLTGNSLGQELCVRCGTRLMIVVEPSSLRFEEEATTPFISEHEAHLLERVSALESRLARMTEKLEQNFDLLLQHVSTSYSSQALLETLVSVLSEDGAINRADLEERWRCRREQDNESLTLGHHHREVRARILASYTGKWRAEFARLVDDGFKLFERGETGSGARLLERAAGVAPDNTELNYFLGEHFFGLAKMTIARDYLGRAEKFIARDPRLLLLLGIACGDDGETARAFRLLAASVRVGGHSFAAHYALGRLHAAGDDWAKALAEFKLALQARPSPEAHCVVGFAYYNLGQPEGALRHLRKCVRMDPSYAEALYLLGVVSLTLGKSAGAAEAFRAANLINSEEPRYRAALRCVSTPRRSSAPGRVPPPALFGMPSRRKRMLVSRGDERLVSALQEDALKT